MANAATHGRLDARLQKLEAEREDQSPKPFLRIIYDEGADEATRDQLRADALQERFGDGPYPDVDWMEIVLVEPRAR